MKTNAKARTIKFGRFGIAEDVRGYHCSMQWKGRTLLGEIHAAQYVYERGVFELTVRHFCGDPWPIKPIASAVTILG